MYKILVTAYPARHPEPRAAVCARHGATLGGESPLPAVEVGRASLGQGVYTS